MKIKLNLILTLLALSTFHSFAQFHNNLTFNGTDNVADCGNLAGVLENVSTYTIEARIKFNSFSQWSTVLCKRTSDPARDVVIQCYSVTGQIGIAVSSGYGYTSGTLNTGQWYHLAVVYDGSNTVDSTRLKLFIDGIQQTLTFLGTVPSLTPGVPGSRFCLGAEYSGTTPINTSTTMSVPFSGTMDEVRIWSSALSSSSIVAGMNAELTLPQPNLVTYYKFNQGTACQLNATDTIITDELVANPGRLWHFALTGSTSNFTTVVDTSVTASGASLSSNATPATYQWYNCGTQAIVPGATNQSFSSITNGNYAVIVTQGCIDTSGCYPLIGVGMNEASQDKHITMYPNPASSCATITLDELKTEISISIFNIEGASVMEKHFSNLSSFRVDLSGLECGLYFIRINAGEINRFLKMVKE